MRRLITLLTVWIALAAHGQTPTFDASLLTVPTGRQQGLFTREDVLQKAVLLKSPAAGDIALLVFRGWPGIARLETADDWRRNLNFMGGRVRLFMDAGISLVVMDCPADQQAMAGPYTPAACDDGYRSSRQHADDVSKVIDRLARDHGFSKFYVFGHSYGTISSKWLAHHLGTRLEGSIHSAAQTLGGARFGYSAMSVDMARLAAPSLHVHHEADACTFTPYATVRGYASGNLVSVRGGQRSGDPCGGRHLHSYEGRESEASEAIIAWIRTREVRSVVGAPD